jgi:hypothetical protein
MSPQEIAEQERLESSKGSKKSESNPVQTSAPITLKPVTSAPIINVNVNINLGDYIQVGVKGIHNNPVLISKYEVADSNNKNYEDAHKFVLEKGLYMPTPAIFMTHFNSVRDAKNGIKNIYDGDGNRIIGKELEDIYLHLTKDHIDTFSGGQAGAWSWLNARFVKGKGQGKLDLETVMGIDGKGNLVTSNSPLRICSGDGYVNLDFNSQGLAKSKFNQQSYQQGKNVYFWSPVEGRVARFYAYSDVASLDCNRFPSYSYASLGVFVCAEGAVSAKNAGVKP